MIMKKEKEAKGLWWFLDKFYDDKLKRIHRREAKAHLEQKLAWNEQFRDAHEIAIFREKIARKLWIPANLEAYLRIGSLRSTSNSSRWDCYSILY